MNKKINKYIYIYWFIDHILCPYAPIFVCTWQLCPWLRPKQWWTMDILKRSLTWTIWMGIGSTCWRIIRSTLHLKAQVQPCRSQSMVPCLEWNLTWYAVVGACVFFCINHHKLNPLSKSLECNSGDEGQALGGNYMLFHWQCDLAPFLSDSGASRYLITTIPSYAYVFDGAVNITLQAAAQHICNSLAGLKISIPTMDLAPEPWQFCIYFGFGGWPNAISPNWPPSTCGASHHGPSKAREMDVYVMGFKGDWKYLYQLFTMVRNPYSEEAG